MRDARTSAVLGGNRRISDNAVTDLPQPDSPNHGKELTAAQLHADTVDRPDDAVAGMELDLEICDVEKNVAARLVVGFQCTVRHGSKTTRRKQPR